MDTVANVILSLVHKIAEVTKKDQPCEACGIEDSSQKYHTCLTPSETHFQECLNKCSEELVILVFKLNGRAMPPVDIKEVKVCHGWEMKEKFMRQEIGTVDSENLVQNLMNSVSCLFE